MVQRCGSKLDRTPNNFRHDAVLCRFRVLESMPLCAGAYIVPSKRSRNGSKLPSLPAALPSGYINTPTRPDQCDRPSREQRPKGGG